MEKVNQHKTTPHFLCLGTAKAGTTSLYHYLSQHPQINIPVKETFFFMREVYQNITLSYPQQRADEPLYKEDEEYFNIYKNKPGILGEIGTGYLYYYPVSGPMIKEYLGDEVKLIILLRNPIDRCFSSYKHFTKDLYEKGTFEQALSLESKRIHDQWDFMWHYQALGFYYEQVKYYKTHFKNVKVILYDDLKNNPQSLMQEVLTFLGISESFEFKTERVFNESGTPKNESLHRFLVHDHPLKKHIIRPLMKTFFSYQTRDKIRKYFRNKNFKPSQEKLNPDTRKSLQKLYQKDIEQLSGLIQRDLSHWLS